ncbi:hypothetical protein A3A66_03340 [Microgenomates group bacterium RIFCSPLOWO2_01_FULL_46_13]|nr:MAG: hypothetical protein A2783_04515 [Microgenomates group bacterium RIFCSPHIGHO2_01_FULL_45_11]OGV95027.1 MAG: hypothetical protein A3A66_03340 [Microgenomates group bacterium RIFCSPLOWO2_01_FULL_46_13]
MIAVSLIFLIFFFSFVLVKATRLLVTSLQGLSQSVNIDKFGLTAFLLAFSTSLPELFVGITAAVHHRPELSLGNVIGANIANLSLVIGLAAVIAGVVRASDEFLREEIFHTFLAGALPLLLLIDRSLSRTDGLILIIVYVIYNLTVLKAGRHRLVIHQLRSQGSWLHRLWYRVNNEAVERWLGPFILGLILLIVSSDMIVRLAQELGYLIRLPALLIGMLLLSVGTTLPELSFEIAAIKRRQSTMALGNVLGSIVTNATLIVGLVAVIQPFHLERGLPAYLLATITFIIVFSLFWLFVRSKKTLERWEGILLVAIYFLFAIAEFYRQ